jgi:hypothetical protein
MCALNFCEIACLQKMQTSKCKIFFFASCKLEADNP